METFSLIGLLVIWQFEPALRNATFEKTTFQKKSKSIFMFTADLQPNHTAKSDFSLAARKTSFLATLGDRSPKVIRFSLDQDQGPNAQGPFLIKVKTCQQPHIYMSY